MSRHAALRKWSGRQIIDDLAKTGILIRSPSTRGVAEEAPGAYKDVDAVVLAERAGPCPARSASALAHLHQGLSGPSEAGASTRPSTSWANFNPIVSAL
ncbi:MAG: RtcB family protein [Methyloceanibacter sp.]|jgi:hypothetical protein